MSLLRVTIWLALIVLSTVTVVVKSASCNAECKCEPIQFPDSATCSDDSLKVIPHGLPPTITKLVLDRNDIRSVDNILRHYVRLTHLSLRSNRVTQLQPGCFSQSHNLAFVDLSFNQLSEITAQSLQGLTNLISLNLAQNMLEYVVSNAFEYVPRLEHLDLSGNRLTSLSKIIFAKLVNLQTLRLSDNAFKTVPSEVFLTTPHLSTLVFSNNDLGYLSSNAFRYLNRLLHLDISSCGLQSVASETFASLESLHSLDLSNNLLPEFPLESLQPLTNLRIIHVGLNYFEVVPPISAMPHLQKFIFKGCHSGRKLRLTANTFAYNVDLRHINITKCLGLEYLPSTVFLNLPFLKVLNLHGNRLTELAEDVADWSTLDWFDITGNNFDCSCSIAWLITFLQGNEHMPQPSCAKPGNLKENLLIELTESEIHCNDGEKLSKTIIIVIVLGICACVTVCIITVVVLRRRQKTKRVSSNVQREDIKIVIPSDSRHFMEVLPDEECHIYEELPMKPGSYPDIKVSVL
jgi:Leucine-rich repeat (LRR) protein